MIHLICTLCSTTLSLHAFFGIDSATIASYKKIGGEFGFFYIAKNTNAVTDSEWMFSANPNQIDFKKAIPGFRFHTLGKEPLPNVNAPFGLEFLQLENQDIALLASLKQLTLLNIRHTSVDSEGLLALRPLKELKTLILAPLGYNHNDYRTKINDSVVKSLSNIGLLHALYVVMDKMGNRPASSDDVDQIILSGTSISGKSLSYLKQFKYARRLYFDSTNINDNDTEAIRQSFPKLVELSLSRNRITDKSALNICAMHLDVLNLSATGISNMGVIDLCKSQAYVALDLSSTSITDDACKALGELKYLKSLNLSNTHISGSSVHILSRLERLENLNISINKLSKAFISNVSSIPSLFSLNVSYTNLTSEDLRGLKHLDALRHLFVSGLVIDKQTIKTLNQLFPNLIVYTD